MEGFWDQMPVDESDSVASEKSLNISPFSQLQDSSEFRSIKLY